MKDTNKLITDRKNGLMYDVFMSPTQMSKTKTSQTTTRIEPLVSHVQKTHLPT